MGLTKTADLLKRAYLGNHHCSFGEQESFDKQKDSDTLNFLSLEVELGE